MDTPLTQILRDIANSGKSSYGGPNWSLSWCNEAAERIEKLEAEIADEQRTKEVLAEALAGMRKLPLTGKLGNISGWLCQPKRFIEWAKEKARADK